MALHNQLNDLIALGNIRPDVRQSDAIIHLQQIADKLSENINKKPLRKTNEPALKRSFFLSLVKSNTSHESETLTKSTVKGMYIWGDVGRGKTWLMDQFYASLNTTLYKNKTQRIHFHEFMQQIHQRLQDLPSQSNPLELIGSDMAKSYQLICLDEFHVMDIADAVILHGLLKSLFENGVTIVTTSNRHPDELYKGGSHRERFIPAIELIKQHTEVFHLDTDNDYRRQREHREDVFFIPHTQETKHQLQEAFLKYSSHKNISTTAIKIFGREIPVHQSTKDSIWFDFDTLCRGMRSSSDYIQIGKDYKTVILSGIPILHEGEEGPARRFLNLIDAFYDQHVYLILSSFVEIEDMYQGDLLQFEFVRALSRLHEMRSHSWWQDFDAN